MRLRLKN